jgi:hypothetical protein
MSRVRRHDTPVRGWWLVYPDGARVAVRGGLLIGRHAECDVIVDEEHVSRHHAQLRPTQEGLEIVPLGRNPVVVDGRGHGAALVVASDATLAIGTVELRLVEGPAAVDAAWLLVHGAATVGLRRVPFVIGGGDDDLVVPSWPPAVARFYRANGALFVEVELDGMSIGKVPVAPGALVPIADGDRLSFGDDAVIVRRSAAAHAPATLPITLLPDRVRLTMLPRGARLTLTFADGERSLIVAERRLELLSALLQPPPPHRPGDYIPDDELVRRVWARSDRADHGDLAVLVHRSRRDLIKAGVNGMAVIAREPGGNGTRFTVRPDTIVTID